MTSSIHSHRNRTSKRFSCPRLHPVRPQRLSYLLPVATSHECPLPLSLRPFSRGIPPNSFGGTAQRGRGLGLMVHLSRVPILGFFFPGSPSVGRQGQSPPDSLHRPRHTNTCGRLLLPSAELLRGPGLLQNGRQMGPLSCPVSRIRRTGASGGNVSHCGVDPPGTFISAPRNLPFPPSSKINWKAAGSVLWIIKGPGADDS